ncbi:hypothetical protein M231_07015 [Tremella mesenterica]|uniref:Uncharacterized protein n=1 Tax=Tremella mesenterica TaxID=5217 RepID=A0A4Q1BD14_TREME|nr:hypothetical protein M231_07015 [Tremella mesenterica]
MSRDIQLTTSCSRGFRDVSKNETSFGREETGIPVPVSSVSLGHIHHVDGGLPSLSTSWIQENGEGVDTSPHSLLLDWLKRKETDDPEVGLGEPVVLPTFSEFMSGLAELETAAKLPTHVSTSYQGLKAYTVRKGRSIESTEIIQPEPTQIDAGAVAPKTGQAVRSE